MKTILCFGEALIDFHAQGPATAGAASSYQPHAGGAPANVAVAVARLGAPAAFAGMLGRDVFGDFLHASLQQAGVNVRHVRRTAAANTALAFVSLDADGERSFTFYRPPAADLLFRAEDFTDAAFDEACVFHVCSNSLTEADIAAATLAGMSRARDAGALVSFDMNRRPALWAAGTDPLPRLWQALHAADVVKLSAEELAFLAECGDGEDAVRRRLWQGRTQLLVVTDAGAPMRWFAPDAAGTQASFSVPAVDTTGAGDAFVGGLLYGLAEAGVKAATLPALVADADHRRDLLRFAAACGAVAVTRRGSFEAMPSAATAREFLAAHTQDAVD